MDDERIAGVPIVPPVNSAVADAFRRYFEDELRAVIDGCALPPGLFPCQPYRPEWSFDRIRVRKAGSK